MRDPVVQCVGPERGIGFGSHHTAVVQEAEFFHHDELRVPSDTQEGDADSPQLVQRDACESVDDVGHAGKLVEPVLYRCIVRPPQLWLLVSAGISRKVNSDLSDFNCSRDGVDGYLVSVIPQLLRISVVRVLV